MGVSAPLVPPPMQSHQPSLVPDLMAYMVEMVKYAKRFSMAELGHIKLESLSGGGIQARPCVVQSRSNNLFVVFFRDGKTFG